MKLFSMALASVGFATSAAAQVEISVNPDRDVAVVAHRACWENGAPEVSVSAIKACAEIAPEIIEIDVRRTRDGALVLMHDETVDRTTNGTGTVEEMSLAEIRALRLRAGDGGPDAPITNELVPTLEEALEAVKGQSILHLHIYTAAEQEVTETVKKTGMAGKVTTWVGHKPDSSALASSPMLGTLGLIPIIKECSDRPSDGCWTSPVVSLSDYEPYQPSGFYAIPSGRVSTDNAHRFFSSVAAASRSKGSKIMASTLFDLDTLPLPELQEKWRELVESGVEIIMTDRPAELIDFLREEKRASKASE